MRRGSTLCAIAVVVSAGAAVNACAVKGRGYAFMDPPAGVDGGLPTPLDVPRPSFGPVVTASVAPPPISGGTLIVLKDGHTAVAADPDRDAVYVADASALKLLSTTALQPGDEPGRLVEDAAGRVHVALRRGGALVTIDPTTGTVLSRRAVCPAPRGVAYDAAADAVWVACATGELVSLPAAGGAATKSYVLERDLRDVVIQSGALLVSKFRSAEVLHVASNGSIASRDAMPSLGGIPHVAWRMVAGPSGGIVIAHQQESTQSVLTSQPGAYGSGGMGGGGGSSSSGTGSSSGGAPGPDAMPGLVDSVVTVLGSNSTELTDMVLPVDIAVSPDGSRVAVVAAGNTFVPGLSNFALLAQDAGVVNTMSVGQNAQATAVAFDSRSDVLLQTREPAALWVIPAGDTSPTAASEISLSSDSRFDTGHEIFHTFAGSMIACASCHPEGGDDGHVWTLDGVPRRTPSLRGTIAGTAPYHWPGDKENIGALVDDVYTIRMDGAQLGNDQLSAVKGWVEAIPAPPAPSWVDPAAEQRGQAIFQRADVGCSSCHSGAKLTNNMTVDVGTGSAFQVPPLVGVGWRTPLLHDGCAATLADRFGKCATSQHGSTSQLAAQDVSDLLAYLESL